MPVVRKSIALIPQARKFLVRLGIRGADVVDDVIGNILPKYRRAEIDSIPLPEHGNDVLNILTALRSDSSSQRNRVQKVARKITFLIGRNAATNLRSYKRPTDLYLRTDDLAAYFANDSNAWFLDEDLPEGKFDQAACRAFGIESLPRRREFNPELSESEKESLRDHERSTRDENIVDYDLDGLKELLAGYGDTEHDEEARKLSCILWKILIRHLDKEYGNHFLKGKYEWFYRVPHQKSFDARLVKRLKETAWIPDMDGKLQFPGNISAADLADDLQRHEQLMQSLQIHDIETDATKEVQSHVAMAKQLGLAHGDIELIQKNLKAFEAWKTHIHQSEQEGTEFPERASSNPERRAKKIDEHADNAVSKCVESRARNVRVSKNAIDTMTWLRNQYTNEDEQLVCQLCKEEMPFKKRNGEYYFESVEIFQDVEKELECLHLALCPLCAAKYKEFVKRDSDASEQMRNAILEFGTTSVAVSLGDEETCIRFVETHFQDLKTVLNVNFLPCPDAAASQSMTPLSV
jgi:hypothetical protein